MNFIDRSNESKFCIECKKCYNHDENKPECLIPCGHTFCRTCIKSFRMQMCPVCRNKYNQVIPDFEMIDMIKGALVNLKVSDSNFNDIKLKDKNNNSMPINNDSKSAPEAPPIQLQHTKQLRPEIINLIMYGTPEQQIIGTVAVRKLLSIEKNPPIQEVIDSGLVPKFIEFLDSNKPQLQFESLWALTNIASGNSGQTNFVVSSGAVPKLIKLLNSTNSDVLEQAVWALGNIAGDTGQLRDLLIENNIIDYLLTIFSHIHSHKITLYKNAIWLVSNLCRGKTPKPNFDKIKQFLPVLAKAISEKDDEVLTDACWALSYLSDTTNENINAIIEFIDLKKIVNLVESHENDKIKAPAIRIIGNIVTGNDTQTQKMIDCGFLPIFHKLLLLKASKRSTIKEICWAISNVAAGTTQQIQALFDENLFKTIFDLYETADISVKKEIAWVIGNTITTGDDDQIKELIKSDVIKILCNLMETAQDSKVLRIALESVEKLVTLGETEENIIELLDQTNIWEIVEKLQYHQNTDVTSIARKIYEKINEEEEYEEH